MRRWNYKSDFTLKLTPKQVSGEQSECMPDCDFDLVFTCGGRSYTCSRRSDTFVNCVLNTDGTITCVFDNHGLLTGTIRLEVVVYNPNKLFPDGNQREVTPQATDIQLVACEGDEATEFEIELV